MKKIKDVQIAELIVSRREKMLLAFGLFFVCSGVLISILFNQVCAKNIIVLRSVFFVSLGSILFYTSLIHIKKTGFFFTAVLFLLIGFLFLLIDLQAIPYTFIQMWPIILIFSALSLFITNFYKQTRIIKHFLVPSILVLLLGIFFLLFSLDIFKFTFSEFVVDWGPLCIIIAGMILVLLFFLNKRKVPLE